MRLAENQHAVEELSAQGTCEPLADRVHAQLSTLRQVAAEHQDGQAEYPARELVDDLEQRPAS